MLSLGNSNEVSQHVVTITQALNNSLVLLQNRLLKTSDFRENDNRIRIERVAVAGLCLIDLA